MSVLLGEISANVRADTSRFNSDLGNAENRGNRFTGNIMNQTQTLSRGFGEIGNTIGKSFNKIGGTMESAGNMIKGVGEKITQFITVPLAAATTAIFKFGKDFESELSKVVGLVGVSQKQVDEWGVEILDLAPKLGKAPKELAEALFYVTSAGIKGAEAMDVLKMSAKGSAAGLGETATIADLVTSAMNAYGKENLSAAKATDIITMAVRQGKAEASELASSMGQVLPLASEMGVTFDQVAAAQAAMTRTGTGASEAATQLKSILAGLLKPSKQAEEQLRKMGTSSSEMRKKIREDGLISALSDLRQMTNKYGEEAMARVYPNIRGLMGVLDLMGSNAKENKEIFKEVADSTGALDEAFDAASATLDFKWNQAISKVQATAISFFDTLKARMLPVLEKVIEVLDWVSTKFKSLSPDIQNAILAFSGIAGIIGPAIVVIGGIIAALGTAIASIGTIITTVAGIISTVGLPVIAAIAAVIAIVIVAIGALVASFIYLWKTNADFRKNVIETWNSIKTNAIIIFNEIKKTVSYVLGVIKNIWKEHGTTITAYMKAVWNVILASVKFAMTTIKNIIVIACALIRGDWKTAFSAIKNILDSALNYIKIAFSNFKVIFVNGWKLTGAAIIAAIISMINRIKGLFSQLFQTGKMIGEKLVNALKSTDFYKAGAKIISDIIAGIKSKITALGQTVSSMASTIRNKLPFSPAKEGPLKDLDKVDFYTSLNKSLMLAKSKLNVPSLKLGEDIMKNLSQSSGLNLGNTNGTSKSLSFNGPMNFYGVEDTYSLMKELRDTIVRYSGRLI